MVRSIGGPFQGDYILSQLKGPFKKGALDLKKGATPRIPSTNLKTSGAKIKIRRKGLSIKDFWVPIFILNFFQPRDSTDSPPIHVFLKIRPPHPPQRVSVAVMSPSP